MLWSVAPTVALLLISLFGTGAAAANQGMTASPGAYVLAVLACLPVLLWRWRPLWTLAGTSTVTLLYLILGYPYGPILVALAVAILAYARTAPLRRTLVATAVLIAAGGALVTAGLLAGTREVSEYGSLSCGWCCRRRSGWPSRPGATRVPRCGRLRPAARCRRSGCGSLRRCTTWPGTGSR